MRIGMASDAQMLSRSPDGRCFHVARSVTLSTLFNLADRNRICLNGGTPNDLQAGPWQTSFSGRGDAHLRRTVNKFQRPSIFQLNIEGLTASKMSVLHHLALQCEALVILLQETHCTSVVGSKVRSSELPSSWVFLEQETWSCNVCP